MEEAKTCAAGTSKAHSSFCSRILKFYRVLGSRRKQCSCQLKWNSTSHEQQSQISSASARIFIFCVDPGGPRYPGTHINMCSCLNLVLLKFCQICQKSGLWDIPLFGKVNLLWYSFCKHLILYGSVWTCQDLCSCSPYIAMVVTYRTLHEYGSRIPYLHEYHGGYASISIPEDGSQSAVNFKAVFSFII